MERVKTSWKRVPDKPRRVLTFIVGMLLVLLAGLLGPVPGPGGTVLFLLGIAVLATEFVWAERLRDVILKWLKITFDWMKSHRAFTVALFLLGLCFATLSVYVFYTQII